MPGFTVLNNSNRRQFLAGSVGCAAAVRALSATPVARTDTVVSAARPKIRLVYTHPDPERQGWPSQHYDYEGRKRMYTRKLREACPEIDFLPVTAKTAQDAEPVVKAGDEVDGYLVYMLGIPSNANRVFTMSGRPTLVVDDLYGGTGQLLAVYPEAVRNEKPVAAVASSRFQDVAEAANTFVALKKLKSSTMIDVTDRDQTNRIASHQDAFGLKVQLVGPDEFNAAYEQSDSAEAAKWARKWIDEAEKVVEPSVAELRKSGAMYLGMKSLLARYHAQGIAVDCLHLFYGKKMVAYPCMGFFQLNNDGLVGACEADLESASTMLLITYLTGRPGYISDPVIDTAKNEIIYAHCVAPNKVYGPDGPANPYHIRDHAEDHNGAAVRSLLPTGEMTTSLKLIPREKVVVVHRARAVENIDEDRACRTKLAAEPADARRLLSGWKYGWHRVTVYGDWKVQLDTVAGLLGFRVVEEG